MQRANERTPIGRRAQSLDNHCGELAARTQRAAVDDVFRDRAQRLFVAIGMRYERSQYFAIEPGVAERVRFIQRGLVAFGGEPEQTVTLFLDASLRFGLREQLHVFGVLFGEQAVEATCSGKKIGFFRGRPALPAMKREGRDRKQENRNEEYGVHRLTPRAQPIGDWLRCPLRASSLLIYVKPILEVLKTGDGWKT